MTNFKKQIKNIFDKAGEISCPAFPGEKIVFNEKRALVSESSSRRDQVSPVPDNRVYDNINSISCQVAESGGHDPQSEINRTDVVIRHSSNLRNSLSNHNNSIARKLFLVQPSNARKRNLEDE